MSKNIVICCDGTGNEVNANLSNVLKLYRILRKDEDQLVFYDPGIGTLSTNATGFSICYVYARKDEALRSSYMTHAEAVVIAEAIARVPALLTSGKV